MDQQLNSPEALIMSQKFHDYVKNPTPELEYYWELWRRENPGKAHWVNEAKSLLSGLSYPYKISSRTKKELWEKIRRDVSEVEETRSVSITTAFKSWHLVAASIALMAICTAVFYLSQKEKLFTKEYTTKYGEIRTIELPDGSKVTLNGNSSLYFKNNWDSRGIREVWISGEAFFAIAKLTDKQGYSKVKFVVHCNKLNVEVLGTQFNVVSRANRTKVSLNEGRIKVFFDKTNRNTKGRGDEIEMSPGEVVSYTENSGRVSHKKADPQLFSSWKDHKYKFYDTDIAEIAEMLELTYGVKIKISDKRLLSQTIRGTVESDNLEVLLKALSITADIQIERKDGVIYFK